MRPAVRQSAPFQALVISRLRFLKGARVLQAPPEPGGDESGRSPALPSLQPPGEAGGGPGTGDSRPATRGDRQGRGHHPRPVPSPGGGKIFCRDYSYCGPTDNDSLFLRGIMGSCARVTCRTMARRRVCRRGGPDAQRLSPPRGPRLKPARRVSAGASGAREGTRDAQALRQSQHSANGDCKKMGDPAGCG